MAGVVSFVLATLCISMAEAKPVKGEETIDPADYSDPVAEFGAFWFWNGEMREDEMELQLREMKEAGLRSVVFHPRFGMGGGDFGEYGSHSGREEIEYYLSDEYFEKIGFCLELCKELGLKVILYDELNWPSGYAGGRVLRGGNVGDRYVEGNPEYVSKHLAMDDDASRGDGYWEVPEGDLVAVIAAEKNEADRSRFKDLTGSVRNGRLKWDSPGNNWRLMFFMQRDSHERVQPDGGGADCCPDLMNEDAIDKFIAVTHDEYYKRSGGDSCLRRPSIE